MLTQAHSPQRIAGLLTSAPSRPAIAFQRAVAEAAPLFVVEAPTSFGPQPWSFREPARSLVFRFFAHLLIRLLVIAPLPPQLQALSVLFPVSILWPLVRTAESNSSPEGEGILSAPAESPLSESLGGGSCGGGNRTRQQRLTSVGGRLAMGTGDLQGVLFSTARSVFGGDTPLGGVRTAALGSIAVIRQVTPIIVPVNSSGSTLEPIEVRYQLIGPPQDLAEGSIQLFRNQQLIGDYPVAGLTDGTYTMMIPAGAALETPPENVDISIRRPDGTLTPPFKTEIRNPDPTRPPAPIGGIPITPPAFVSLSPNRSTRGASSVSVTVTGSSLGSLRKVHIRAVTGEWSTVDTTSRAPTQVTFNLPASALSQEGFIQVSPIPDERASLAFLVSAPGLPSVNSGPDIKLESASPDELGVGGKTLHVAGEGFVAEMRLVLGRGGEAGFPLPTTFVSDTDLEAELPPRFIGRAEDLFVAVLSADGASLSGPLPLQNTISDTVHPATQFAEGEVGVTSIEGDIYWNAGEQELEIEGVGLEPGMEVVFTAYREDVTRTYTAPLRPGSFKVTVPEEMTSYATFSVWFRGSAPTQPSFASAPSFFAPQEPFLVPFGGQAKFVVKKDRLADRLYILKAQPMGRGLARPSARNLALERLSFEPDVSFAVTENPLDTRGSPTVQVERERFDPDPDAFYLRGLHLTSDPDTGTNYGPVTIQATKGAFSTQMEVRVVERPLGRRNLTHDSDIMKVANRYGIPPHFLKSQVEKESGFAAKGYRYEPMSIDFRMLTGDWTIRNANGLPSVYGDAQHDPSRRWIEQYPFDKYAIEGRMMLAPAPPNPPPNPTTLSFANPGQTDFPLGVGSVLSRSAMANTGVGRRSRVRAGISGAFRILSQEPLYPFPRWSRALRNPVVPPTLTTSMDWSVDYEAGQVRLYQPLGTGESLNITFEPVVTVPITEGDFGNPPSVADPVAQGLDLNAVSPQHPFFVGANRITYVLGERIADWFQRNLGRSPGGGWLVPDIPAEWHLEFNYATKRAVDTRLGAVTAQYLAAASYGPLQVTLLPWLDDAKKTSFDKVLKVEEEPLYKLATDWDMAWDKGVSLAGAFHQDSVRNLPAGVSCGSPCDSIGWARYWSRVFRDYNEDGPKYRLRSDLKSEVIVDAEKYEPF